MIEFCNIICHPTLIENGISKTEIYLGTSYVVWGQLSRLFT
jgi:hypothetical protein